MGTYVEGSASFTFNRELDDDEYARWCEACTTGKRAEEDIPLHNCWRCKGSGRAKRQHDEVIETCPTCEGSGKTRDYMGDYYDSEGWTFDGSTWGDVGIAELARNGFTIEAGGKVYDITDAARFWVEHLPADVLVTGFGSFESDSQPWCLWAHASREVIEDNRVELPDEQWKRLVAACEAWDAPAVLHALRDIMEVQRG